MFPPNDSDWIIYIQSAIPDNVSPCWVDIVGDMSYPAAYYYLFPPYPDLFPTEVAFRMRLNGDPLNMNPNLYVLKEFVWGVVIRDESNNVLYTIQVNASGSLYNLQVIDSSSALIYDVPITLNNPSLPTDNVRVVDAGANFPCLNPMVPDEDYFLDFTLPTYVFGAFNFVSSTYRLCYFTSTQDNVINRDFICGMIINPPIETPVLCVTKQILSGHGSACVDEIHTWLLLITIFNCDTVAATNVVLSDTLNSDIVFSIPPIFIPSANVSYNTGTRVVTWNVGTVNAGDTVALTINLTGSFASPGHYILNSGTVTGTNLTPIIFGDHGILIYKQNQLTVTKEIISGPLSIEKCRISTWTLRITVTNTDVTDIPNVMLTDHFSSSFTIESGPQFTPSAGTVIFSGEDILWNIDVLAGISSETLLITATGFFSTEGHIVFDSGFVPFECGEVSFEDPGIDVLPASIVKNIEVSGDILDCSTGELLDGVSATVYDHTCKIINSYTFDQHYELSLPAGIYSVLFEKDGYRKKFLSLVLQSDLNLTADVNMAPKAAPSVQAATATDLDLFSGIVCEKIDADIVYSSLICVNSEAQVECLNDIIDRHSCSVVCTSKLRLTLDIEKNLVYRLNQTKQFKYDMRVVRICYPLSNGCQCTNTKCYTQVKQVLHCKEQNLVYNIAYLSFTAYLLNDNDILVNGTPKEEC